MERAYEKFLRYVKIDTESDPNSGTLPSSIKQFDLAKVLVSELLEIGVSDAHVDDNCYVMASIKGNVENAPSIGLIAHMDTSPDFSGKDVNSQIIKNYDGKDILLNKDENIVMKVSDFPDLELFTGKTLITTDGTTLLGADNKAGIAEIMVIAETLINNPDIKHGDVKIAFTPDEEIGSGADQFDVEKFGADFAYTLDGALLGEIEYENFNAASANIAVNGVNIHPGSAKDKMKNSVLIAMELNSMLPVAQTPSHTEEFEGFFHLNNMNGTVEKTDMLYIIRDHDMNKFTKKKELITKACTFINDKYGQATVTLDLEDSYFNMKEKIVPVIRIVENAIEAMITVGIKHKLKAIRGGTDGARLSFMGLPTPNLFTGGFNYHGKFEAICIEDMDKAVDMTIEILKRYGCVKK
ncbi:MAG: peptidase T [Acidaminobacteraceae bacterium]